jgi:hypothetical protein
MNLHEFDLHGFDLHAFDSYEFNRYATTRENVLETLDQYGVAIIPNVLSEIECQQMRNGAWEYLEHITQNIDVPIKQNNPTSWKSYKKLFPKNGMLLQQWGIGHAQFNWNLRQNPKIVDIFAHIWNVDPDQLFVSFDGSSFSFPPETTNFGWKRGIKLHCDQSFMQNDFKCIQSWIGANDTEEGDATLCVLEGSHKYHAEFKQQFNHLTENELKNNWFILSEAHINWFIQEKNCELKYIKCPKGSLVLWDSRLIHSGSEPMKNRPNPKMRIVSYLCYMPKQMSSNKNNQKRIKAYEELRTTSHWVDDVKIFPKIPRTYGEPIPPINNIVPPVLTNLGMSLVGFNGWI